MNKLSSEVIKNVREFAHNITMVNGDQEKGIGRYLLVEKARLNWTGYSRENIWPKVAARDFSAFVGNCRVA